MQVSVLRIPDNIADWHLVHKFLKFRKDVFINRMSWELHHSEAMEFEQYDRIDTVYVIAHVGDTVVGGARLVRTDRQIGFYSYMIRDACKGLLPGMPRDICDADPPVSPQIWELTRLAALPRAGLGELILTTSNAFLSDQEATECLFLGPPAFMRMAKTMQFEPRPLGKVTGNGDGRFLAFACGVRC